MSASATPTAVERVQSKYSAYAQSPPRKITKVAKWALAFFAVAGGIGFIVALATTGGLAATMQSTLCIAPAGVGILSLGGFALLVYRDDKRDSFKKDLEKAKEIDKTTPPEVESDEEEPVERNARKKRKKQTQKPKKGLTPEGIVSHEAYINTPWGLSGDFCSVDFTNEGAPVEVSTSRALNQKALPQVGQFGKENYEIELVVKLPKEHIHYFGFKKEVKQRLLAMKTDVYFIIYHTINPDDYDADYRDLSYHAMVFPDAKPGDKVKPKNIEMVMGTTAGIARSKRYVREKRGKRNVRVQPGIPHGQFQKQKMHIQHKKVREEEGGRPHFDTRSDDMQPVVHRGEFKLDPSVSASCFSSAAITNIDKREAVAVFGVVVNDAETGVGGGLRDAWVNGNNVADLGVGLMRSPPQNEEEMAVYTAINKALQLPKPIASQPVVRDESEEDDSDTSSDW